MTRSTLFCLIIGVLLAVTVPAAARPAHPPRPVAITVPGGLRPDQDHLARGDCELAGVVTCRPTETPRPSCTGYTSQTTPPATIRVLVRTPGTETVTITTVDFRTYVQNVLPNEWLPSWDGDALKAGAVAVKSYAWYWVTHFGGYVDGDPTQCFDVTDDADFQVYKADTAVDRTNQKIDQSWPVVAKRGDAVMQTEYRDYLVSKTESCGQGANGTRLSQYGSQACNEANTGNKYNVILEKYYGGCPDDASGCFHLATARQQRATQDFTFTQTSTRVTFRSGRWSIDDGYPTAIGFGQAGDRPISYSDGEGFAHLAVYRPGTRTWYVASPDGSAIETKSAYGNSGDVPAQARFNGVDHDTVLAMYRPSTHTWYRQGLAPVRYGETADIPVPGAYHGTAANSYAAEIALFRPSTARWFVNGYDSVQYGAKGDAPVPADYDGNGTTDIAVYRPSTHQWYIRGHAAVGWGVRGDIPVTGDFTGDGKADIVMYRPSTRTWYLRGGAARTFGDTGATPLGAAPYHG